MTVRAPKRTLVSFSKEELVRLKRAVTNDAHYASRISTGLLMRMIGHESERHYVLREIDALEGNNGGVNTKPAQQFKRPPLAPLWHKHFFAPRHLIRNIGESWGIAQGTGNKSFNKLINDHASNEIDTPAGWTENLVHEFAFGGLTERAKRQRMTGDWIIFGKHEGQNYYLDLATHEEGRDDPAQLVEKLRLGSHVDFPFLFDR